MKDSVEVTSVKCSITSAKAFITFMKVFMIAFVNVTSMKDSWKLSWKVLGGHVCASFYISISSMEAFTEAPTKAFVNVIPVKASKTSAKASITSMKASIKASVEVTSVKASIPSAKASITPMKAYMEAFY